MAKLFSVVIPTYDRLALLRRTLSSVFAQQSADFEVIVVDDGSSDGTREWLVALGDKVRVLTQDNRGPGAARNMAASHARGEYLAFLDSDDLWFPWSLQCYRDLIHQEKAPSFVVGKPARFVHESELLNARSAPLRAKRFRDYFESGDEWRWWGVSSFVIKRDAFIAAGSFSEANINGEDGDLALKLGDAPGFVQITSPCTFGYREHSSNLTTNFSKSVAGATHKVRAEQERLYPGGAARAKERRRILTRHTRAIALACLDRGMRREAWQLYRATFTWNARLGRVRYLAAFPLMAAIAAARNE